MITSWIGCSMMWHAKILDSFLEITVVGVVEGARMRACGPLIDRYRRRKICLDTHAARRFHWRIESSESTR